MKDQTPQPKTPKQAPQDTITPDPIPKHGLNKPKMGRPTLYTPELAATICNLIADGRTVKAISNLPDMPSRGTIRRGISEAYQEGGNNEFRDAYTRAKQDQADAFAEDTVYIADNEGDVNRAKVMINARQWYAGKLKPKKYGDIKHIDGQIGVDINIKSLPKPVGAGTSTIGHAPPKQLTE